jgi:hypothetical protein
MECGLQTTGVVLGPAMHDSKSFARLNTMRCRKRLGPTSRMSVRSSICSSQPKLRRVGRFLSHHTDGRLWQPCRAERSLPRCKCRITCYSDGLILVPNSSCSLMSCTGATRAPNNYENGLRVAPSSYSPSGICSLMNAVLACSPRWVSSASGLASWLSDAKAAQFDDDTTLAPTLGLATQPAMSWGGGHDFLNISHGCVRDSDQLCCDVVM